VSGPASTVGLAASPCDRCKAPLALGARFCGLCGEAIIEPGTVPEAAAHRRDEVTAGRAVAVSDQGAHRSRNEDRVAVKMVEQPTGAGTVTLCVVCDGVASTERADEAAQSAVQTGMDALTRAIASGVPAADSSRRAFREAADVVVDLAGPDPSTFAPACTYVSVVVQSGEVTVAWVGDTRAYWIPDDPDGEPRTLTEDDVAAPAGEPGSGARRSSVITGWVGARSPAADAHRTVVLPSGPGLVLVCTDGLWRYLPEPAEMAAAVVSCRREDLAACAQELVRHALARGGRDNISVALLPVEVEL
jgi:serine/threonine protein phosphatase PrpC